MLLSLWNYRGFVLASARREFEARYRVSMFGGLWAILNPVAQIAVYTAVLSGVMQARLPGVDGGFAYSIYLCAGIITWTLFSEIISRTTNVFVENANLLKKLAFPRICLPATIVVSSLVNFAIVLALFLAFLALVGAWPGWPLVAIVPVMIVQVLLAIGIGVLLGVANVFYRDTAQGVGIALQFLFWLTPIVYPLAVVPERFRGLIEANPMTGIARAYQDIFVRGAWPSWPALVPAAVLAALLVPMAMAFFRRRSGEMVDEL